MPSASTIETWIEQHPLYGWQIHCNRCGNCGGNYQDQEVAELYAKEHALLFHETKS